MNRSVTSHDVAKAAGVSRSAVSLVLNNRADGIISAENQEAVREAAEALGYRPNRVARSLRNQVTHTIGVVTDYLLSGAFGGAMISGATLAAAEADYLLLVMGTEGDPHKEREAIETLQARQVDALVFAAEGLRPWSPPQSFLREHNVLLDALDPQGRTTCVVADEVDGGYRAARLLVDAGHERITYLTGTPDLMATGRRLEGFHRAMTEANLEARVVTCGWEIDRGLAVGTQVLDVADPPTGVLCANDRAAAGVFLAAARLGLRIPEDLSVVGYDDDPNVAPQLELSTVGLPHRRMGERAIKLLIDQIDGLRVPAGEVLVDSPVLERRSVAPPTR